MNRSVMAMSGKEESYSTGVCENELSVARSCQTMYVFGFTEAEHTLEDGCSGCNV